MIMRFMVFLLLVALGACAHPGAPSQEQLEQQGEKYHELGKSKAFSVVDAPYLGALAFPLSRDEAALGMQVVMRRRGSLSQLGATIGDMTGLTVSVNAHIPEPISGDKKSGDLPLLEDGFPGREAFSDGKPFSVSYEGALRGLLDNIAVLTGYGWDFDAKTNTIVFARLIARTFTILATPGKVKYEYEMTNKSQDNMSMGIGARGVGQTQQTADTSAQTFQTNTAKLEYDVWADTEKAVKFLLSKEGSAVAHQMAGTITVRDRPQNVRQIAAYIQETNAKLSRQVILMVQVWSLEVTDDSEAGLNLQALFVGDNISVAAGSLTNAGTLNTTAVTVVSGKLKDSTAVLKALKQWGRVTQVTSHGGPVMSNTPFPVMAIKRRSYLAAMSSTVTSEYGRTTEMVPGKVTSGFAMTLVPHILEGRKIILQYDLDLTAEGEMKEIKQADTSIQLPQTATRAFSPRGIHMQMGQTLVLTGFQQETQNMNTEAGLFGVGRKAQYGKTMLVITIETESADIGGMEG